MNQGVQQSGKNKAIPQTTKANSSVSPIAGISKLLSNWRLPAPHISFVVAVICVACGDKTTVNYDE